MGVAHGASFPGKQTQAREPGNARGGQVGEANPLGRTTGHPMARPEGEARRPAVEEVLGDSSLGSCARREGGGRGEEGTSSRSSEGMNRGRYRAAGFGKGRLHGVTLVQSLASLGLPPLP